MVNSEFTEQERHMIDDMHRRNLEGLSADEVGLLMRWTSATAAREAENSERVAIWRELAAERSKARHEQAALAKQNLKELRDAALARLEAIDGA